MHAFYQPQLSEGLNILSREESHHIARVLRMQQNEAITLLDGQGNKAQAHLTQVHDKSCEAVVESLAHHAPILPKIHLYLAPPKSNDRLDFIVEKSCELGVNSIHFVHCRNSERKKVRVDKLEQKVIAACKQSLNPWFPVLYDFESLTSLPHETLNQALFFNCREDVKRAGLKTLTFPTEVNVFIGPEGDFSADEIEDAMAKGATAATLGTQRLRTETAVLTAIVQIQTLFS